MKIPQVSYKLFVIWLLLCAGGGALIAWLSGMPFWLGFAIVAGSLLMNGLVAEVEDRSPGGFLHDTEKPKPTQREP
jgi:uncharacterized membrane protein YkvI